LLLGYYELGVVVVLRKIDLALASNGPASSTQQPAFVRQSYENTSFDWHDNTAFEIHEVKAGTKSTYKVRTLRNSYTRKLILEMDSGR
jgi:hypothetical protein